MERPTLPLSRSLDSLFNELPALPEKGYQGALSPRTNQVSPKSHDSNPLCFCPSPLHRSTAQQIPPSPSPPPPPPSISFEALFSMSPWPDSPPPIETGQMEQGVNMHSQQPTLPPPIETGQMYREAISTSVKKTPSPYNSPPDKRPPDALAAPPSKKPKLVGYNSAPEPSILKCGLPVRFTYVGLPVHFTYVESSIMNSSVKITVAETYQQIFLDKLTLNKATSFKNADIPYLSTKGKQKEKIYLLEIYKAVLESDPHTVVILKRKSGGTNTSNKNNQNGIVSDSYRHCKISGSSSPQENATHKNHLRKKFKKTVLKEFLKEGHILKKIHSIGKKEYRIVFVSQ